MLNIFTKLFGTKFDRDVKKYTPIVEETLRIYDTLQDISSDELRDKTNQFRDRIQSHLEGINEDIHLLEKEVQQESDFGGKESLFQQIDELKKDIGKSGADNESSDI
jgi:preprotein translocase subunit SecA